MSSNSKFILGIAGITLAGVLNGCASTSPAAPPQPLTNMESFKVVVPKDLLAQHQDTWNVDFRSFKNGKYGSSGIYNFYSVSYHTDLARNEFKVAACNGEKYDTGNVYQSCVNYISDVTVETEDDQTTLTFTPKLKTESKDGLLIPKPLPNISIDNIYGYLSSQKVAFKGKVTSKYSSESIKGNFDRLMKKYSWKGGKADAAHRQFKDTYTLQLSNGVQALVSAGFYPYKNGSMVEYVVQGISSNNPKLRILDWTSVKEEVTQKINNVVDS